MKILLTGGAGYIGSHTAVEILNSNNEVVIVDNLSNSNLKSIERIKKITGKDLKFYELDLRNKKGLDEIFKAEKVDAVIHFAGLKAVGESVQKPLEYYDNNLNSTLVLLEVMKGNNVKKIVFSSSATVYGTPEKLPLDEGSRVGVGITNPYGWTKYMIERILMDLSKADKEMSVSILRYFNPIGAHDSGLIGEDPNGIPNNLLPYISQVAIGKLEILSVFGNDYDTDDGTGVRDYIHVVDLAKGHLAALENIRLGTSIYNLGTGKGTSVLELVNAFKKVSEREIPYQIVDRREGDIATCFANCQKAENELGWHTEKTIEDACRDSWRWQKNNPNGYRD